MTSEYIQSFSTAVSMQLEPLTHWVGGSIAALKSSDWQRCARDARLPAVDMEPLRRAVASAKSSISPHVAGTSLEGREELVLASGSALFAVSAVAIGVAAARSRKNRHNVRIMATLLRFGWGVL